MKECYCERKKSSSFPQLTQRELENFLENNGAQEVYSQVKELQYLNSATHYSHVLLLSADVNECWNQTVCGHGRCVNTEGSYRCNCFQGFKLSPDSICKGSSQSVT